MAEITVSDEEATEILLRHLSREELKKLTEELTRILIEEGKQAEICDRPFTLKDSEACFWAYVNSELPDLASIPEITTLDLDLAEAKKQAQEEHRFARQLLAEMAVGFLSETWYHFGERVQAQVYELTPPDGAGEMLWSDEEGRIHSRIPYPQRFQLRSATSLNWVEIGGIPFPRSSDLVIDELRRLMERGAVIRQCEATDCQRFFEDKSRRKNQRFCGRRCRERIKKRRRVGRK